MFKKIPIWVFADGTSYDIWINPNQITFALKGKINNVDVVNFYTTTKGFIYKGTPAQLAALLA